MVRHHYKAKLLCIQGANNHSTWWTHNGGSSSGLIAEIFLQHIEHSHLICLTHKHKIINYCRYVDVILLIFDSSHTCIQKILDNFNSLHPKLRFTAETEKDHTLKYLDIAIHRNPTNMRTAI